MLWVGSRFELKRALGTSSFRGDLHGKRAYIIGGSTIGFIYGSELAYRKDGLDLMEVWG